MHEFRSLAMETTTVCNSKCVVCPHDTLFERPVTTMPMALFEKILWDLHDNHKLSCPIRFGGMGDSSCDKLLVERLLFARRNMPDYRFEVSSNMALWKPELTDALVEKALITKLRFSLLAYTDEGSLSMYKRADQARKACEAFDYFVERNNAAGNPIKTEIYTLLLPEYAADVEAIKARYWDAVDLFEVWRPHSWANIFPELRPLVPGRMQCSKIETFDTVICVDGDVTSCSMDINHKNVYGNLARQSISEVIEGEVYSKYREINRQGRLDSVELCSNCVYINNKNQDVLVESKSKARAVATKVAY